MQPQSGHLSNLLSNDGGAHMVLTELTGGSAMRMRLAGGVHEEVSLGSGGSGRGIMGSMPGGRTG